MVKFAIFVFSLCVAALLVKFIVFKEDSNKDTNNQEKKEETEEK